MDYFPAFLRLDGKPVLLVGGGSVALRKARLLLESGARLTVVAPELNTEFMKLAESGRVHIRKRCFDNADVDGHWLVVSATDNAAVEAQVAEAADRNGIFCNAVDDPANCSYITPAIVDRSPIVIAISSGGSAPVLARRLRTRIETLLPEKLSDLASFAGRWRQRVASRLGNFRARLRFWESVFDGPVAKDVLGGNYARAEERMAELLFERVEARPEAGEAWLVGAGPGDPGLLTLNALRALQAADVVLYDRLVSAEILSLARRDADFVPVGKTPGCATNTQASINALLVRLVSEGKRVCRIKGGDPFIFGRGGEELEALEAAGLVCHVVPGITAAAGCAAAAGIPLTHRDHAQSVVLLTAHGKGSVDSLDWPSLARDRQTLAVYMGVRRFAELMTNLTANGRSPDTPVAIIERGTTSQQRVLRGTLGQLPMLAKAEKVEAPAMLIIGEVARLGQARETPANDYTAQSDPAFDRAGATTAAVGF